MPPHDSNAGHRCYPAGRIDDSKLKPRRGATKYADWAVGDLIEKAGRRPWFKNTLFVIMSDHCAVSAGKSELDVSKFHIPAMIYNPSLVPAKKLSTLCSQIDVMPTVFGLMNWSYDTLSYGHDLMVPDATSLPARAFVSNYQKIALVRDDKLAILKPKRESSVYNCDVKTGALVPIAPEAAGSLVHDTTAFYQSASWLFNSGKMKDPSRKRPSLQ